MSRLGKSASETESGHGELRIQRETARLRGIIALSIAIESTPECVNGYEKIPKKSARHQSAITKRTRPQGALKQTNGSEITLVMSCLWFAVEDGKKRFCSLC